MPIGTQHELRRIDEGEFHEIDYVVTGLAFQVHRELGPWFIDEAIYRNELARICESKGIRVRKELAVCASYDSFAKTYFLDLVVNESVPYELKVAEAIHPKHRNQTLNYLLLTGLAHAKIINMRCASMQYEFVSTTITPADRRGYTFGFGCWIDLDEDSRWLSRMMRRLIQEWGVFLDVNLFCDAIEHFRGGTAHVVRPIQIVRGGRDAGRQLAHLMNPRTAFKFSAVSKNVDEFEKRLRKFLSTTSLFAIQWVNFSRQIVRFKTLCKSNAG